MTRFVKETASSQNGADSRRDEVRKKLFGAQWKLAEAAKERLAFSRINFWQYLHTLVLT
jgi:hypothetical protein